MPRPTLPGDGSIVPTTAGISSVVFDRHERLLRAVIGTSHGTVKVTRRDVQRNHCWFACCPLDTRRPAIPATALLEHTVRHL